MRGREIGVSVDVTTWMGISVGEREKGGGGGGGGWEFLLV